MKELYEAWKRMDRHILAAGLSVVPGLGHLYKHHYAEGFGILLIGNALIGLVAALMVLGTFGLSLLLVPAAWVAGIAWAAYLASDEHGHHPWLHVWDAHWRDFVRERRGKSPAEQSRLSSGL
jgi:hypothetical protein